MWEREIIDPKPARRAQYDVAAPASGPVNRLFGREDSATNSRLIMF